MQAIKEKLTDMKDSRECKSEAKEMEKVIASIGTSLRIWTKDNHNRSELCRWRKNFAKAKTEVVHEVRLAREAEDEMDFHVKKAAEKAADFEQTYPQHKSGE